MPARQPHIRTAIYMWTSAGDRLSWPSFPPEMNIAFVREGSSCPVPLSEEAVVKQMIEARDHLDRSIARLKEMVSR